MLLTCTCLHGFVCLLYQLVGHLAAQRVSSLNSLALAVSVSLCNLHDCNPSNLPSDVSLVT